MSWSWGRISLVAFTSFFPSFFSFSSEFTVATMIHKIRHVLVQYLSEHICLARYFRFRVIGNKLLFRKGNKRNHSFAFPFSGGQCFASRVNPECTSMVLMDGFTGAVSIWSDKTWHWDFDHLWSLKLSCTYYRTVEISPGVLV